MGLSSSKQDDSSKFSSQKTPYKALRVLCTFKETDESRIRKIFQLLPSVKIRIPGASDRACSYFPNNVCFYEADFVKVSTFLFIPLLESYSFI